MFLNGNKRKAIFFECQGKELVHLSIISWSLYNSLILKKERNNVPHISDFTDTLHFKNSFGINSNYLSL